MNGYLRRALIAALAAAFTFAVLWWAAAGLGWMRQDRPVQRLLASRPDLVSYRVGWSGDTLQVEVLPVAGVDLPLFYSSLCRELQVTLGHRPFAVRVQDRRDATLGETMRVLRLYLEEAQATGRFTWADDMVNQMASRQGLEWARLGLDSDRVYVELRHGTAYLYEVIPRARQ